jgi:hypothetical protein
MSARSPDLSRCARPSGGFSPRLPGGAFTSWVKRWSKPGKAGGLWGRASNVWPAHDRDQHLIPMQEGAFAGISGAPAMPDGSCRENPSTRRSDLWRGPIMKGWGRICVRGFVPGSPSRHIPMPGRAGGGGPFGASVLRTLAIGLALKSSRGATPNSSSPTWRKQRTAPSFMGA